KGIRRVNDPLLASAGRCGRESRAIVLQCSVTRQDARATNFRASARCRNLRAPRGFAATGGFGDPRAGASRGGGMGGFDRGSARRVTAGMMALIGAGLFFVLLAGELPGRESADWDDLPTGIVVRYIVTMALGSAV